jgi:GAF domain-containing protein
MWRREVKPFSENQVALVKTFADQAVIAIENSRLFRELTEALEQQTATSEILRVIASSPTDLQPVLDVVAENAARLLQADNAQILRVDGDVFRVAASFGRMQAFAADDVKRISRGYVTGRAIMDRKTIHVHDLLALVDTEYPEAKELQERSGHRTTLVTPLIRDEIAIGAISILRTEVRPFTEKHIELLQTFADQAVIAIENVRLFKELQDRNRDLTEALEQQTATSEILRVIASSPTEIQTVMDTIAENAARLCDADDVLVRRTDGVTYETVSHYGSIPHSGERIPVDIGSGPARAILERRIIHVHDIPGSMPFRRASVLCCLCL